MEKTINKYSSILDKHNEHLNYSNISTYINLHSVLSNKERNYIENHLSECLECLKKFNDVFDEDIVFDDKTITRKCYSEKIEDGEKIFRNENDSIELAAGKNEIGPYIKIIQCNTNLNVQNLRITIGEDVIRIVSAEKNKNYYIEKNINIYNSNELIFQSLEIVNDKKKYAVSSFSRYFPYAAAASILLAALIIFYFYFVNQNTLQNMLGNKIIPDTTLFNNQNEKGLVQDNKKLFSENQVTKEAFEGNQILESFINRNLRSSSEIKIISPAIGDTIKDKLIFIWKPIASNIKSYILTILNNKNKVLFKESTIETKIIINNNLPPGLYYWKIQSGDKLASVGKFYVK